MSGTSLLIQWLRIHQPRQGTWVQSLFWEDSTCCGAAKPMCHNYWASRVQEPQLSTPEHLASCCTTREATTTVRSLSTATWSPHLSQLEKTSVQQQRPSAAKNKSTFFKKKINFLIKKKKRPTCLYGKRSTGGRRGRKEVVAFDTLQMLSTINWFCRHCFGCCRTVIVSKGKCWINWTGGGQNKMDKD